MAPFILSLAGCGHRKHTRVAAPVLSQKKGESAQLCEAKWSDIPLPLGIVSDIEKTREAIDESGCIFAYTTSLQPSECLDFYKREMERLGWKEDLTLSFNTPIEYCVMYQKPTHLATLMVESTQKATRVKLYNGFKKSIGHGKNI